jgi:anti-sigma factor ChrR (cupin superfamily)
MLKLTATKIIPNIFSQFKNIPENNWQPLNSGVEISYIYKDETTGAAAAFIRYAPGTRVKPHQHLGYEHIIVLEGEQSDDDHSYVQGSLAIQPPTTQHEIKSVSGCVVLAIWSGPLKFVV